jgi:signal transduction histidine kinase/ActR/RegA family two-component response regulator
VTPTRSEPTNNHAVRQELFRLGYRNLPAHMVGNAVLSSIVAAGVRESVPAPVVVAWWVWMLSLTLVFVAGLVAFKPAVARPSVPVSTLKNWGWASLAMMTIPGAGWGSVGFLFVPADPASNLMVMTTFAGAVAYSSVSNAYDMRGFFVSIVVATLVLLSQIPGAFPRHAVYVMGMTALYMAVMIWVARNAHATLVESIELRLANEELARKNAEIAARAEQANRDKSEFLAAASHDLRQPVHALLLLVEAYRQQDAAAARNPLVAQIAAAAQSIGGLFNALMELSRLESGLEQLHPSTFDLLPMLQLLTSRQQPAAERKGLNVRLLVSRRVPQPRLHTDRLLLERVVSNLLTNALRYTLVGGVRLVLRPTQGGQGLRLEVWDTGIGIAPQDQDRVFDPYVQVANRERDRSQGLGLGLAIVAQGCRRLGVTVQLRSRPGRGSCFRLTLPAALCVSEAAMQPLPAPAAADGAVVAPAPWLAGRRLLLIDDDVMIQRAMLALLGSWGLDVRVADRGEPQALAVCGADWLPDAVLCDFRLPGALDGIAMLDLVQERHPQAACILQTGELAQTVQARAEEAGYLVLFKPVEAAVLASTLAAVLERRQNERG